MSDAQSTIVGLKAQDCPGGGWTGQPADLERATVADCVAHGVCGCIYGDAVQHIERLQTALEFIATFQDKTLIAPSLGEDADRGHQIGANKAFNQAADIARGALAP